MLNIGPKKVNFEPNNVIFFLPAFSAFYDITFFITSAVLPLQARYIDIWSTNARLLSIWSTSPDQREICYSDAGAMS